MNYHKPVLIDKILNFVLTNFDSEDCVLVDACFGEGGYTDFFLTKLNKINILGIEQDTQLYNLAKGKYKEEKRVILVNDNFVNIDKIIDKTGLNKKKIIFIVFDLGISMYHIKASDKGISFNSDTKLDMRLSSYCQESAYDIINNYSKEELADIFYNLADETMSRQIASAIVEYRKTKKIETNKELVNIICNVKKQKGKNPATKVFMALRIKVNNELENLKIALNKSINIIEKKGRIAVVSYHSGEDRIVKNFIKENKEILTSINKKVIVPDFNEIKCNPSARSAKLRVFEKL